MSLSGWVWVLVRVKQHLGSTSGQDLDTQSQVQHAAGARKCIVRHPAKVGGAWQGAHALQRARASSPALPPRGDGMKGESRTGVPRKGRPSLPGRRSPQPLSANTPLGEHAALIGARGARAFREHVSRFQGKAQRTPPLRGRRRKRHAAQGTAHLVPIQSFQSHMSA